MKSGAEKTLEGDVLAVGEIGRPHGIKGEVKIYPYSGSPDSLKLYVKLIVRSPDGSVAKTYKLSSSRSQKQVAVVKLEGIDSRNAAELLTGSEVLVERQEMPELAEDEFYWHDLEGMAVFTLSGRRVGTVVKLLATGAHDILVIADRGREYLIPAVDEFVRAIDLESGTITVDPPEGLLEMNG